MAAANIDKSWVGVNAVEAFSEAVGRPCTVLNDADGAGLAEMRFGAGKGVKGVVLLLTLGTGIGSALFVDGALVPNLELGHIEIRGRTPSGAPRAGARYRRASASSGCPC
jgi:polyphosphate glucokinase